MIESNSKSSSSDSDYSETECLTSHGSTSKWTFPFYEQQQPHIPIISTTKRNIEIVEINETTKNKNKINNTNSNNNSDNEDSIDNSTSSISSSNNENNNNYTFKNRLLYILSKLKQFIIFLINEIISFRLVTWIKLGVVLSVAIAVLVVILHYKVEDHMVPYLLKLQDFVANTEHGRLFGGLIYIGGFIVLIVCLIPVTIPTIVGGIIFGFGYALLFVWIASMVGGTISFTIGRFLLRDSISKWIQKNKKMIAVDRAVAQESWKLVLLLRFTVIVPESILNYALAVAKVSYSRYLICTAIGLLPGTSFFIYLGSVAGGIAQMEKQGFSPPGKGKIAFYIVSGVIMVVNIVFITIIVKRAVAKKLKEQEELDSKKEQEQLENGIDEPSVSITIPNNNNNNNSNINEDGEEDSPLLNNSQQKQNIFHSFKDKINKWTE